MRFKDEMFYTYAPQAYGEIFVMKYDGTEVEQLTDNQWEGGGPAWQPRKANPTPVVRGNSIRNHAAEGSSLYS